MSVDDAEKSRLIIVSSRYTSYYGNSIPTNEKIQQCKAETTQRVEGARRKIHGESLAVFARPCTCTQQ